MIAFLVGLIIGFLMCIPIGPIGVWVIHTYLKKGFPHAYSIALGGSLMDFIYFFTIMTGLSFVTYSIDFGKNLQLLGIGLIFILGIIEIARKYEGITLQTVDNSTHKLLGSVVLGVVLYTSNPTLVLTMTGLGAFVKSLGYFDNTALNNLLVSIGLAVGSATWFLFLIGMLKRYEETVKSRLLTVFNKAAGVLMVLLSLFMSARLYAKV